mmetsp:Transcript_15297/g.20961  ORF Transcript_15297/g.20961 Transcript_15297/m.20961 type:complete len:315 (-) Transcript_15297:1840-2784(-)
MTHTFLHLLTLFVAVFVNITNAFSFGGIKSENVKPSCVYFSGAGIYFWWQMGAAKYMKENCSPELFTSTPILGASAGSITASLLLTNADLESIPDCAIKIAEEWKLYTRKTGLAGVWGGMLKQWLEMVIPETVTAESLQNLHIALTPTFRPSKLVTGITERSDLIDAIMASCHVPIFLDGRPFTDYKGEQVVDGSFWYFVTKDRHIGLPLPENINVNDIFWVDYVDDEDFTQSISGNFLELITPAMLFDMVESGYNYMKREHHQGRLPLPKSPRPSFSSSGSDFVTSFSRIPSSIVGSSIRLTSFAQAAIRSRS